MSRRTGWGPSPDRSREAIRQAWIERHLPEIEALGSRASGFVTRRLNTLVSDTVGLFPDIEAAVHMSGERGKVGWKLEPPSVPDFESLMDRLGPLAISIVRQGLALLEDPKLRRHLEASGIQPGRQTGELDWTLGRGERGEQLLTFLGQEVSANISVRDLTDDPAKVVSDPQKHARAVDKFIRLAQQTARLQMEIPSSKIDLDADLKHAEALCRAECGLASWEPIAATDYQTALNALVRRWDGRGRRDDAEIEMESRMRVRFAHTLIHPDFYKYVHEPADGIGSTNTDEYPNGDSWKEILVWFRTVGADRIVRGVKDRRLQTQDEQMLLSENFDENLKRLMRTFLDAYVDAERMPDDWSRELIGLTTVRGLGDVDRRTVLQPEWEDGTREVGQDATDVAPWEQPYYQERDSDATARAYWRDRDIHLTETPEFLQFVLHPRHKRQPYVLIDHIVFFATHLVEDAELEVFGRSVETAAARSRSDRRKERATSWIERELPKVLLDAYRRIPKDRKVQRERADLGLLMPALDLVAACGACAAEGDDEERLFLLEVGEVVRNATQRATILAVGRKARQYQEEMANG